MTYQEAIEYLFNSAPMFQNVGAGAYKEGLDNTLLLDGLSGHPHRSYRTIHVGGTNGKGSVSHTLAAILQSAGYKVGLYTSPHLVDFRERIRVNGEMIPEVRVVQFVEDLISSRLTEKEGGFSFFELTTALAFKYFEEAGVDIAVIEVGLGGRLDCTNIITPILSVITNISFDHIQFLGDTLEKIAREKAGIIKPGVPVVIGETNGNIEVKNVFELTANELHSEIHFADELRHEPVESELKGDCQAKNTQTILTALECLKDNYPELDIPGKAVREGFLNVCKLTGLMGRWQTISKKPLVICDTGHNVGGWVYLSRQLERMPRPLHIIIGMVSDKDVTHVLKMMPRDAQYYFTQASVKRAMPAEQFAAVGKQCGLTGKTYPDVASAYAKALQNAGDGSIFVGGSTFIVSDLLCTM